MGKGSGRAGEARSQCWFLNCMGGLTGFILLVWQLSHSREYRMSRPFVVVLALALMLAAYFVVSPTINDSSCEYFRNSSLEPEIRVSMQLFANCWVPWN